MEPGLSGHLLIFGGRGSGTEAMTVALVDGGGAVGGTATAAPALPWHFHCDAVAH